MNNIFEITKLFYPVIDRIHNMAEPKAYVYKILGIIFLRYMSDSFDEARTKLLTNTNGKADPEDVFEYLIAGEFFIPKKARWNYLKQHSRSPEIGSIIDKAIGELQHYKYSWKGCLPDGYADENVYPCQISELIEIISTIDSTKNDKHIWLYLFEYILGRFPMGSEKYAGEFYSPRSVIQLMVKTLNPDNGNVYDPCCGMGSTLMEANKYINEKNIDKSNVRFYGQEQSADTVKLTTMFQAMMGMDTTISIGDTFENDYLPEVKADYILANPPFNISWPVKELKHDERWMYGVPSARNANYLWLQHSLSKLSDHGTAAVLLPNGSLNSKSKREISIRRKMIEAGNISCIIALPSKLFFNTTIPVSIWILTNRKKRNDILFINATELELPSKKYVRELPSEVIEMISDIYHKWREGNRSYQDIPGLCKSTPIEKVIANCYSLLPSLYVDSIKDNKNNIPFDEKMHFLYKKLSKIPHNDELESIDDKIRNNLYMNRILSEIVNAVFTEWFIHFNSPHVSENRKESEFGPIPNDWEVMPLEKFCNLQMGYPFKSKDFKEDEEIGIIKIKNIRGNFVDISPTKYVEAEVVRCIDKKYKVESNSLLIAMSGSDVGKVALVPPLDPYEELWLNQRVGMFKEKIRFGNFFLYHLLSSNTCQSFIRKSAIGSAQPNIGVTFINEMRVIIPPTYLIEKFGGEMYPMFEKILANHAENKKLEIIG